MECKVRSFGKTLSGQEVTLFTLKNSKGMECSISDFGGIIVRLLVPDKHGKIDDVVLGFPTLQGYLKEHPYFGAIIGRYANRIAGAAFQLENYKYLLEANNGPHHLHGGIEGFDRKVWKSTPWSKSGAVCLKLTYLSLDGEEGYPGNLEVTAEYELNDDNELSLSFEATTDKSTVINLTGHSYFDLGCGQRDTIYNHELRIMADHYLPVDQTLIPSGTLEPVDGTPFDFRKAAHIGRSIADPHKQLQYGGGYDHTFVIRGEVGQLRLAAQVFEPVSGRCLDLLTTEPGIQFYSANSLDGSLQGKERRVYGRHSAFCLEPHHYPDSPNQSQFPGTELRPGEKYRSMTKYRFHS